jgi:glycosyltransferase involved in cell wall biosynthesis
MHNNENPLVTIAIPTFNRADGFLKQALHSAINQTYRNIEIIVSDNCSIDHTETLVKSFDDSRIKYHKHPKNIGANNNFNFCVNQAQGLYFVLLPDDDLIDRDFIETCMAALDGNYELGAVFTGNRIIDENNKIVHVAPNVCSGLSTKDFFTCWFESKFSLYLCSTLLNTEKLKKIGGFKSKTNVFQDVVAEAILVFENGRADVHDPKASFRRHSDNIGGKPETVAAWCDDSLYLHKILCEYAKNDKDFRNKGIRYFAIKNFNLAKTIPSFSRRLKTYLLISRKYSYSYTYFHFLYRNHLKPIERKVKIFIKSILNATRSFKKTY